MARVHAQMVIVDQCASYPAQGVNLGIYVQVMGSVTMTPCANAKTTQQDTGVEMLVSFV